MILNNKLMKKIFLLLLVVFTTVCQAQQSLWDINHLKNAPQYKWLNSDTAKVREIIYTGEAYGKLPETQVFAYYATPGSISGDKSKDQNLPAIVLVHGGGGYAFKEWVTLWAERGYAAISMDLSGKGIDAKPLPNGGPSQDPVAKFTSIDSTTDKQWVYHSVANIILAHSLIRSFKEVNADKTAITGISWGGYLTCMVSGLDDRFKAAIPVYGCGFIYKPGSYFYEKDFGTMTPDQKKRWVERYDASNYVGKAKIPFLWVTGTNDQFYPPNCLSSTYNLVKKQSHYLITTTMVHGHPQGWAPKEIGEFTDRYLLSTAQLPQIKCVHSKAKKVSARIKTKTGLTSASLSYTIDTTLPYSNRKWQTVAAAIKKNKLKAPPLPANTTIWILNVTDDKGSKISSPYYFTNKRKREEE
jgi:cephalosporin-C deacetylase-like acetyl esterase